MMEMIWKIPWETIAAIFGIFTFITGYKSLPELVQAIKRYIKNPNFGTFIQICKERMFFLLALTVFFSCVACFKDVGTTKGPDPVCGDIVELGSYKQIRNLNGNWDASAINWIVLDVTEDKILLLSKDGLTYRAYSENSNSSWDNSSLRIWLNQEFVQTAFTDEELSIILTSNDKSDLAFCLSKEQVLEYLPSANERICIPTVYAMSVCESNPVSPGGKRPVPSYDGDYWWITDRGESGARFHMNVRGNGEINQGGTISTYSGIMVRPAIWVSYDGLTTMLSENEMG